MNSSVLVFVILLVAYGTCSVESQDCPPRSVKLVYSKTFKGDWSVELPNLLTFIAHKSMKSTAPNSSISSVVYRNGSEVTNLSAIGELRIFDAYVKFIPTGIKRVFPNLGVLCIRNSGLLSVNKDNLREFGDSLKALELYGNKIVSIDGDVFEYNPNLKMICLDNNPLRFIEPTLFENLKKLQNLERMEFNQAGCINNEYHSYRRPPLSAFDWMNEKCDDESARELTLEHLTTETSCFAESSDDEELDLLTPRERLEFEMQKLRNEALETRTQIISELSAKMEEMRKSIEIKMNILLSAVSKQ